MASINVVAPDRSSLDSFQFLNETLVCKCIVYQVVTSNSSKLFWGVCALYRKLKQDFRSRGWSHFSCPYFGLLLLGFSGMFPFSPLVILCSRNLPVQSWCTKWRSHAGTLTELLWSHHQEFHVWQRLRGKSEARRNNSQQRNTSEQKKKKEKEKLSSVVWKLGKNMQNGTKKSIFP